MTIAEGDPTPPNENTWQTLLRWRWLLAGVIALAFALGRLAETLLLKRSDDPLQMFDLVVWSVLGGAAVWVSLTWASRQERRYQLSLEQTIREQRSLNRQLERSNSHLALLSEVNNRIAASAMLDEILDAAVVFPQRLVPARATALLLNDATGPIVARLEGAPAEALARQREALGIVVAMTTQKRARQLTSPADPAGATGACLALPLYDGQILLGWIELYLDRAVFIPEDELALLDTIANELAEAISSSRRRSREERAIYELERAISEERARIARDIHDGIAQSLAFRRMRVDLWLDWLTSDPERLRGELIDLKADLREQIAELRRAIFALRPIQFDEFGFVGGLHRYVSEFASQQGWSVEIDFGAVPPALSFELEAICFRVVQEALTNSAKHARATAVAVRIDQVDQGLQITVRDNGRGFEPGRVPEGPAESVGLRQMRERLAAFRGQLTLLSQPGAGTEVRAWVPLERTRPAEQAERRAAPQIGGTNGASTAAAGR
ncbi:MAG: sensor histidine kinase [Roseiflexaceae bacterium]